MKKFDLSIYDKIQFAFINDVVKIVIDNIRNLKIKNFKNKTLTISNKPFMLKELIDLIR